MVQPSKIKFLISILYPKRRIESYSIMGTIVSPNKILLKCLTHEVEGDEHGCKTVVSTGRSPSCTWTPKVCKIMAFMAIIMGLGLLFYIIFGV